MAQLTLPRTTGCLVCGRDNPHGLQLRLSVDDGSGFVSCIVTPRAEHIGFTNVIHGGLIATVFDEAMVWAATWRGRRFCYCAQLEVRFRKPARPGEAIRFEAEVIGVRSRVITTSARCVDANGNELSTAVGKYMPLDADEHAKVVKTFVDEPDVQAAAQYLRST